MIIASLSLDDPGRFSGASVPAACIPLAIRQMGSVAPLYDVGDRLRHLRLTRALRSSRQAILVMGRQVLLTRSWKLVEDVRSTGRWKPPVPLPSSDSLNGFGATQAASKACRFARSVSARRSASGGYERTRVAWRPSTSCPSSSARELPAIDGVAHRQSARPAGPCPRRNERASIATFRR